MGLRRRSYIGEGFETSPKYSRAKIGEWILADGKLYALFRKLAVGGAKPGAIATKLLEAMRKAGHATRTPDDFGGVKLDKKAVEAAVKYSIGVPSRNEEDEMPFGRRLGESKPGLISKDQVGEGRALRKKMRPGWYVSAQRGGVGSSHRASIPMFKITSVVKNLITGKDIYRGDKVELRYAPKTGSFRLKVQDGPSSYLMPNELQVTDK